MKKLILLFSLIPALTFADNISVHLTDTAFSGGAPYGLDYIPLTQASPSMITYTKGNETISCKLPTGAFSPGSFLQPIYYENLPFNNYVIGGKVSATTSDEQSGPDSGFDAVYNNLKNHENTPYTLTIYPEDIYTQLAPTPMFIVLHEDAPDSPYHFVYTTNDTFTITEGFFKQIQSDTYLSLTSQSTGIVPTCSTSS